MALELRVVLSLLGARQGAEHVRVRERFIAREDQLVVGQLRVECHHRVLGAHHRRNVVDVGRDLRRDLRVVVEVDQLFGVLLVSRPDRHDEVVVPERAALAGDGEVPVVAGLGVHLGDVAGPDDRGESVAVLQVFLVRVALDVADLTVGDLLLQFVDGGGVFVVAPLAIDGDAHVLHDAADRVAHLRQHTDASLERRIPQVRDGGESAGQLVLVPGDSGETALPRHRHRAARIEVHVLQCGDQVLQVRDVRVVELLGVAEPDEAGHHPVGQADRVAADVLAELELVAHLAVVGVVVVDGLGVGGLDPGLLLNACSEG